jgi:hypothetical protein
MGDDDLEALDIVPVDLEPVDADSSERTPGSGARSGARPWLWGAVLGAGLIAWAAIALTARGGNAHSTTPPTSIPAPASQAPTPAITTLEPRLADGLRGVGSGRFAIVVDDRLYLLNIAGADSQATLVPLPEGHVTIDDQSGTSLLASTFQQTLVSTQPAATHTLAVDEVAIRGGEPNPWVLLRSDGTIRDQRGDILAYAPAGLRVFGAVDGGYVADDPKNQRWVLWSTSGTRTIAPGTFQLLDAGPRALAFKSGCGYSGCDLELVDLRGRITASNRLATVPQFAALSPDGTRLALASTQGSVSIVDTSTAQILGSMSTTAAQNVSLPFSWTPDGRDLVVVGENDLEILRASDGVMTADIVVTPDLEQLVALP